MKRLLRTILDMFTPLRSPNFRVYMLGQAVSLVGTNMQITGQAWVVWELSHSAAALGLVAMLSALPALVLGPWVGAWADRLDRRRLLTGTATAALMLACSLALLVQLHLVRLWHVYALALLLGMVTACDQPAQNAFIGDLGGVVAVHKSFTLNAVAIQVSRMIGPAIAGWIIGVLGVSSTFWLNGLSFVAVIYSLLRVQAGQVRHVGIGSPLQEFGEGIAYMRRQPRLADLVAFTGVIVLFGFANTQIFPAFVSAALHGGPSALGALLSAFGAGALVSALVVVPLCQRLRRTGLMLVSVCVWSGCWFVLLSLAHTLWLAWVSLFLAAFGQPVVMTTAKALIQRLSPANMWGRLLSVQLMVSSGLQPFASLGIGFAAQALGAPLIIGGNGVLMMTGSLLLLLRRGLGAWEVNLDGRPAAASAAAD